MDTWKIKPVFDRRKIATSEKMAKVEIEVYFSRTARKFIPTEVELYKNQWDGEFVCRHAKERELNKSLYNQIEKCHELIKQLRIEGKTIDLTNFTLIWNAEQEKLNKTFTDYLYDRILEREMRASTRRAHLIVLEAVKRFGKIKSFSDLTIQNIELFDRFLRKENPSRGQTTLHGYHKRLKPYIREIARLGYIEENPYNRFVDKRGKYKTRQPLLQDELNTLRYIKLPEKLSKIRDLFIFCCYTGLAYADLELFDYHKVVIEHNGIKYINGERLKTGSEFYTPLLPPAEEILKKYDFKLRVPSVQKINDYLHIIEERMELKKPLTSHIARHYKFSFLLKIRTLQ